MKDSPGHVDLLLGNVDLNWPAFAQDERILSECCSTRNPAAAVNLPCRPLKHNVNQRPVGIAPLKRFRVIAFPV